MERLIAIGDIHGCLNTLKKLIAKIEYNKDTDTLVFLGDYIDRGPFSRQTVEYIRNLQKEVGEERCICLLGNHEDMAIRAVGAFYREAYYMRLWERNGCKSTLYSYNTDHNKLKEDVEWFKTLPLVYETPEIIFCHAGLPYAGPEVPVSEIAEDHFFREEIIWDRDWLLNPPEAREYQVIFGHTPRECGKGYQLSNGDICIDAGCVYDGALCACVLHENGGSEFVYENKAEEDKMQ